MRVVTAEHTRFNVIRAEEQPSVLVVEDEYFQAVDIEEALTDAGFATDVVSSGEEAASTRGFGSSGGVRVIFAALAVVRPALLVPR
jgi:hypothetical protein